MTRYVATINTPGYLPMDDDPPVFDTAHEAWSYLIDERDRALDQYATPKDWNTRHDQSIDECMRVLACAAKIAMEDPSNVRSCTDTVYGSTPSYDGDHDLGLAYTVSVAED